MTSRKRGKQGAKEGRKGQGVKPPKLKQLALEMNTGSSDASPDASIADAPSPPSPLTYVTELTPDERRFVAAQEGRSDLREEIAFMRLSLFRAERSHADSKELTLLARALQQLVNMQNRLSSHTAREFGAQLDKALDAIGEKWGREL